MYTTIMKFFFSLVTIIILSASHGYCQEQAMVFNSNFAKMNPLDEVSESLQKDIAQRLPNVGNVEWYKPISEYGMEKFAQFTIAYFHSNDTVLTVMYSPQDEWVATESRITKKGKIEGDENEYPSFKIFPKSVKKHFAKGEYEINVTKKESAVSALMDAYKIELNPKHAFALEHKSTVFYAVNMDGVAIVVSEKKLVMEDFYNFYDTYFK